MAVAKVLTIDTNVSHQQPMDASTWLTLAAVILLLAALVSSARNSGSWAARRTWLLIAVLFLAMSTWLRFGIE
jgi:hypothetical protein